MSYEGVRTMKRARAKGFYDVCLPTLLDRFAVLLVNAGSAGFVGLPLMPPSVS